MAGSRVFISYAFVHEQHPDYLFAQRLAKDLRQTGADVIVDEANVHEQSFVQKQDQFLSSCQWLIVVQTPDALQSPRVHMAVNTALNLMAKGRLRGILAIIAAQCDAQEVPLTWDSLSVIDAIQDYPRASARMLLELNLHDTQISSSLRPLPSINSISLREDRPVVLSSVPLLSPTYGSTSPAFTGDQPVAPLSISAPIKTDTVPIENQQDSPAPLSSALKNKVGKRNLRRHRILIVVAVGALVLITVAGGILYASSNIFVVPTASVTIIPASSELNNTFDIWAVTGVPDTSNHQVAVRLLSVTTPMQKQTVQVAGQRTIPGTRATGEVYISNFLTSPLTLNAGTIITNDYASSPTIQIMLDAPITVPAAANSYLYNTVPGSAHVVQVGTIGNSAHIAFFHCEACGNPNNPTIGWVAKGSFEGGTDPQTFSLVQQSDIDGATEALIKANTPNPRQALQAQIHPNEQLASTPHCKPNMASDHAVGDRATSVTVSLTFTCTGEVYDHDAAMALAAKLLNMQASSQLGSGFVLVGNVITTLANNVALQNMKQKGFVLTIAAEGLWRYQFRDTQKRDFARLIAGKSKQEAKGLLLAQAGVAKVNIQITGGDGNSLPQEVSRVTIIVIGNLQP